MATLTSLIDNKIDKAIAAGKTPDYIQITNEVVTELDRSSRKEAVYNGVRLRARYRLRQKSEAVSTRSRRRSR